MSHDYGGGHAGHTHGVSADADARKLAIALGLILGFMAFELVTGLLAHSLALLSDAAHMLTDAAAIGLSLVAIRLAARPAKGIMTYGLKRVEILSAQVNGVTLLVLAVLITVEAVRRLITPPHVGGGLVLGVALVGVAVNLLASWTLARASRQSLNVEGSFQHILTDLYAFIATAIAGGIILATGFGRADAIASLIVAALMLRASYGLLRDSGRIFLEAAPKGLDPDTIGRVLADQTGVWEVHDLHIWEISSGFPALRARLSRSRGWVARGAWRASGGDDRLEGAPRSTGTPRDDRWSRAQLDARQAPRGLLRRALTAHVLVVPGCDCHAARRELADVLHERFEIDHTTLQVDHAPQNEILTIEPAGVIVAPEQSGHPEDHTHKP